MEKVVAWFGVGIKAQITKLGMNHSVRYRELNSLMGMVKLVLTVICGHEDPAARKATILQLSPPALAHTCLVLHPFMSNPSKALSGGTSQACMLLHP